MLCTAEQDFCPEMRPSAMASHSIWCECDLCWKQLYPFMSNSDTQIRLLKIDHQGQGVLQVYDLNKAPSYSALSYAWRETSDQGLKSAPGNFLINGKRRNLAHNLWLFLDNQQRFDGPKFLWIDSICIDQKSLTELNNQVALMKEIYTTAERVMVWLGDAEPKVRPLFIALGLEDRNLSKQITGQKEYDPFTSWDLVDAVHELFKRNYWTRTWIVQEFVLASTLVICCGAFSIGETALYDVCCNQDPQFTDPDIVKAATFLQSEPHFNDSPAVELLMSREQRVRDILKYGKHSNAVKMYIESFFPRVATGRFCSDPRDRVYAILGLVSDEDIKADYKCSLEEVFLRTVGRPSVRITARFGRNALKVLQPNKSVFLSNALRTEPMPPISTRIYYNNTSKTNRYASWEMRQPDVQVLAFCGCAGFHRRDRTIHTPGSELISPGGTSVSICNETPDWYCITSSNVQPSDLAYWYPDSSLVLFVRQPSFHSNQGHQPYSGYVDLGFVAHDSKIESHLRLHRKFNYSFLRLADEARQVFASTEIRFKSMRDSDANAGWSLEAVLSPAALMFLLSRADTCPTDQKEKMAECFKRWGSYGLTADVFRHQRPLADQTPPLLRAYSSDPLSRLQLSMERTSISGSSRSPGTPPMTTGLFRKESDLFSPMRATVFPARGSEPNLAAVGALNQTSTPMRATSFPTAEPDPELALAHYQTAEDHDDDDDVKQQMTATFVPTMSNHEHGPWDLYTFPTAP